MIFVIYWTKESEYNKILHHGDSKIFPWFWGVDRTITMTDIMETLISMGRISLQVSYVPYRCSICPSLYCHNGLTFSEL